MGYVTPEQIAQAKALDLLTYLQRYDPHQLVHVGGSTYCTREHDSLKISNGKWHWFSRGIGGKTALDYLVKVQGLSFTQAVEMLAGRDAANQRHTPSANRAGRRESAVLPPVSHAAPKPDPPRKLLMPELNPNSDRALNYLMGRGIHPVILDYCLEHKLLAETKQYHNALFAGYDREGEMRYAALRGTMGDFKGEVTGSDKHYSFSISENAAASSVHLFESAIDLLSYATLLKMKGRDWQKDSLLSLAGVYQTRRENVVPIALSRYLQDHPGVHTLYLHLDNDAVGRAAAAGIAAGIGDRYEVLDRPPPYGKDVNELLQRQLAQTRRKEDWSR